MPIYEVELADGRKFEVEAHKPPTPTELEAALGLKPSTSAPVDSGQSYASSAFSSVGRGAASIVPNVIGGVGYLTGSDSMVDTAQSIEGSINEALPVNPAYADTFGMKAFNAVGQALGMVGTGGAGIALKGGTKAIQGIMLGQAFLAGTRGGGQRAEEMGLEGGAAYGRALLGGVTELATEKLLFGLGSETAALRKLGGETIESGWTPFVKAVGTESVEEGTSQAASNVTDITMAPTGFKAPGLTEGVLESMALGALGGGVFGGISALTPSTGVRTKEGLVRGGSNIPGTVEGAWYRQVVPTRPDGPVLELMSPTLEGDVIEREEAKYQAWLETPEGLKAQPKPTEPEIEKPVNEVVSEVAPVAEVLPADPSVPAEAPPVAAPPVEVGGAKPVDAAAEGVTPVESTTPPEPVEPVPAAPRDAEPAVTTPPEPPKAALPPPAAAAAPAENSPTGIRNAIIDQERKAKGLEPVMKPSAQSFGGLWDMAMRKVDRDPLAGTKLVDDLTGTPRTISGEEVALLEHEIITRDIAYENAREDADNATDANRAERQAALDAARERYDQVTTASEVSGSHQGLSLVSRQMMVNRDFTLAGMERTARIEVKAAGKEFTPNHEAWVKHLYDEMVAQNKITDAINKSNSIEVLKHYIEQEIASVRAELEATKAELAEAQKAAAAKPKEPKPEVLKKVVDRLQAAEDKAWANIRAKSGQVNFGFDPTLLADYATIVASWTAKGVKSVADLTNKIVAEFGEAFRAHADEIIAASKPVLEREARAARKRDNRPIDEQVAANAAEGKAPVPRLIRELVREQLENGVTDHKQVATNVAKRLEPHHPGITERQVMDLYSGYGKVAFPSKEDIDVKLRGVRTLMQMASKIEDAKKGKIPLKTGMVRGKPTPEQAQEIREMQKELRDSMIREGLNADTRDDQIKSSLDGVKTRLKNLKADLEKQLATGEKTARRPGVDYDPETKALKAEVDNLRKTIETIESWDVQTLEDFLADLTTRSDVATKTLQKSIDDLKRRIKEKDFSTPAQEELLTQQLTVMRGHRDALREQFNELKEATLGKKTLTEEQRTELAEKSTQRAIEDLERRIKTLDFSKPGQPVVESAELKALRETRDTLREQYQELRERTLGKKKLTDEQRIEMATKALEKAIAVDDARIAAFDYEPRSKGAATPETPEIKALRERRKEQRDELEAMRKLSEIKTPDELDADQLARDIAAIDKRTENLDKRIKAGDFTPPVKKEPLMSQEKKDAQFRYNKARGEFIRGVFEMRLAARSTGKKVFDGAQEVLNTSRAVLTAGDLSGVGRQGAILALANPLIAARALAPMWRAMRSEKADFEIAQEIANDPMMQSGFIKRAGLDITTNNSTSLKDMEEVHMSRFIRKIPTSMGGGVVRGSERAYRTFLNKLRFDVFKSLLAAFKEGPEPTLAEAKHVAYYVNIASGRGDLGKLQQAAVAMNTFLFAPRWAWSRFQFIFGAPFYEASTLSLRGTSRTRRLVAAQYARFLTGVAIIYGVGTLFQDEDDAELSFDPRSSDFGKIRYGNTRLDPLAGLSQVTTLLGRITTGEKVNAKGKAQQLRGEDVPYGSDDIYDVMGNFARSKFSPIFGAVINLSAGKNVVGEPTSLLTEAGRMVVPMSVHDISKVLEEQGMPKGVALSMLAILGMGVQTYDPTEKKAK